MHTLHSLLNNLKEEFASSRKGEERGVWFVYTLLAIILPFTSSNPHPCNQGQRRMKCVM